MESDGYGFGEHQEQHEHHDGSSGQKHLLFVWKPSGYELIERDGEPPSVGSPIDLGDRTELVTKIGPSPLPGDRRPCAYLLG
jgi:hypothetical protein